MSQRSAPFDVDVGLLEALPAEERAAELAKMAKVSRMLAKNPLWRYVPHEGERGWKLAKGIPLSGDENRGQQEFHEIARPYGAFVAGNRSGKSTGGVVDNLIQTLSVEFLPPWLIPYKRWGLDGEPYFCRVVGVDLVQWLEKVMLPTIRKWVPRKALWRGDFDKAYNDRKRKLQFEDGSWWDFLTHDMPVDAYAGAALHRVHFDEEPEGELGRQQYEESLGRLVDFEGEVRWTLTPLLGLTFAYHELTDDQGNPRDDVECKVVRGDIDHNPHLSDTGRKRFLKKLEQDPLRRDARKSGRWVHFAGLVYDEFSRELVIPDREIPRASVSSLPLVPIYAAIDPGINEDHKMGLVMAWLDSQDVMEVFHVRKEAGWTAADMAEHFHNVCREGGFVPRWTVIDPSARNKNPQTGRSIQQEFMLHRVVTIPGQNARVAGFNAVKERLRSDRLRVHASCEELVFEFEHYRWKRRRLRSEDSQPAEPIKKDDDLLDALRYLVMSMPVKAKDPVEEERELSPPAQAFRHSLKRLAWPARRVGGVPA